MGEFNHDVIDKITAAVDTGCEAVEHLVALNNESMEISFKFALETFEMLFVVQQTLINLQEQLGGVDITQPLQPLINSFTSIADAFEAGNKELYNVAIYDIYSQYMTFYTHFTKNAKVLL
ncbi:MAG: hypothetical protein GX325_10765 [Peptococcaceae bacterium]|nr:hypothetical protein [Peptococcaceae bacterium]